MYKTKILENGLTIIGEEIPYLKSITLGIWINAGSRIEEAQVSGTSHFIEHMMLKEPKTEHQKRLLVQ